MSLRQELDAAARGGRELAEDLARVQQFFAAALQPHPPAAATETVAPDNSAAEIAALKAEVAALREELARARSRGDDREQTLDSVAALTALREERGSAGLRGVASLQLSRGRLQGEVAMPALVACLPHLVGLTSLNVRGNELTKIPPEIGLLTALTILLARFNKITELPPEIGRLSSLKTLRVESNRLRALPVAALLALPRLEMLVCHDNKRLVTPPPEVANWGGKMVLQYLRLALADGRENTAMNLVFVGNGESGKTSLKGALMSTTDRAAKIHEDARTVGIEVTWWDLLGAHGVEFKILDLAGQAVYALTNQVTHAVLPFSTTDCRVSAVLRI